MVTTDLDTLDDQGVPNFEEDSMHILEGDGILILSLKELFSRVKEQSQSLTKVYIIRCCYFEIYND